MEADRLVDEIKVSPEDTEEDQEHIDEMVSKAEGDDISNVDDNNATDDENSKLLAGKYESREELEKGFNELLNKTDMSLEDVYKDLESNLGKSPSTSEEDTDSESDTQDTPTDKEISTSDNDNDDEEEEDEDADEEQNGFDFSKYEQELMENDGQLSEDSYEELEEQGFPREMINQYIKGLQALAQEEASKIYEVTDGEENYQEMINWAQDNLDPEEIEAFNKQVNSSVNSARFAAEALYNRYIKANGTPPDNLVQGETPDNIGNDTYKSREQLRKDMSDPKYKSDPAFRRKVEQKLERSDIL